MEQSKLSSDVKPSSDGENVGDDVMEPSLEKRTNRCNWWWSSAAKGYDLRWYGGVDPMEGTSCASGDTEFCQWPSFFDEI